MKNTLIRSLLKLGSGAGLTHGALTEANAEIIVSALLGLLSVLWGIFDRRGKSPAPASAAKPPLLLLLGIFALGSLGILPGCSTPSAVPHESRLYYTLKDTHVLVDNAMRVYAVAVVNGSVSAATETRVDAAHERYRAAFQFAAETARGGLNSLTPEQVQRLADELVLLISQL